jgi:hypothetical protein
MRADESKEFAFLTLLAALQREFQLTDREIWVCLNDIWGTYCPQYLGHRCR